MPLTQQIDMKIFVRNFIYLISPKKKARSHDNFPTFHFNVALIMNQRNRRANLNEKKVAFKQIKKITKIKTDNTFD